MESSCCFGKVPPSLELLLDVVRLGIVGGDRVDDVASRAVHVCRAGIDGVRLLHGLVHVLLASSNVVQHPAHRHHTLENHSIGESLRTGLYGLTCGAIGPGANHLYRH